MSISESAPPRLTRLELQGFKSFANRTVFVFDPGITAVIGPNGSGKSNISDGVRWVLGETSHSLLRSRKTEDVIFAGGNGKAPAGMAEVTVTFDNSTGWLPIEFSEVTVSRRAYRSGENQYLINGRKARLKDVQQLTASLGHSHTVVGQGLVDAALSQRAEERRALFEHAADLTGLQLKLTEAERNLAEAEANAERINDLLSEVEPRLRTLERIAKQAREWQGVRDRLRYLEQGYFRQALTLGIAELAASQDQANVAASGASRARDRVEQFALDLRQSRVDADAARARHEAHRANLDSVADQLRRLGHERDLAAERLSALQRRQEDMQDAQQGLDDQLAAVERDLENAERELETSTRDLDEARRSGAELQGLVVRARDGLSARERQVSQLSSAALAIERQVGEAAGRHALLEQQRESAIHERERMASSTAERARKIAALETELTTLETFDRDNQEELDRIQETIARLQHEAAGASEQEQQAGERVTWLIRQRDALSARLEALQRIQESGAGLFAGVRAVLQAARAEKLDGVRGTVSELLTVSSHLDTAIEVALGSHMQDIVVDRWLDAEQAIAMLRSSQGGRATFQPIDTVRPPRIQPLDARELGKPGVHGVAADLVNAAPGLDAIVRSLLGRMLIVDDLDVVRALLPGLPAGWSVTTLAGEIARSGGSVTGGSAVRESGMLGRERDLRELPGMIEASESELRESRNALSQLVEVMRRITVEQREQDSRRSALVATRNEREGQIDRLTGWLGELRADDRVAATRREQLEETERVAFAGLQGLDGEIAALHSSLEQARTSRQALTAREMAETDALREIESRLAESTRRLAGLEERVSADSRRKTGLLSQLNALRAELTTRGERHSAIAGEIAAVSKQVERLTGELDGLTDEHGELERAASPASEAVAASQKRVSSLEGSLEQGRQALLEAERRKGATDLGVERARGELATLRQRIFDDLEMDKPDDLLSMDVPLEDDLEEVGREISRLRERLKRVGYVGEEAVEEFERESERHRFLRTQLDDVEGASLALRSLLGDLRSSMQRRFDATFEQVAVAFSEAFTVLFGGGTARLVLVPSENGASSGVDIVAQPPGKRLQSLALLSGGERALTAAALLFAILKVNPTPFVLLDEVDAALDEANIVRFREQLQTLARETQAVIITHNRGTIEVADALYGVSMRDDGISTVLSLRMREVAQVG